MINNQTVITEKKIKKTKKQKQTKNKIIKTKNKKIKQKSIFFYPVACVYSCWKNGNHQRFKKKSRIIK